PRRRSHARTRGSLYPLSPRFRRLARDDERTAEVLAGWHGVAFTDLMLTRVMELAVDDTGS
ncbi:MAG TPA: hypothetical protein VD866_22860, partial [Urbifossiella sp.]|nr:hypothetical protein [Urbifossiella sp.]